LRWTAYTQVGEKANASAYLGRTALKLTSRVIIAARMLCCHLANRLIRSAALGPSGTSRRASVLGLEKPVLGDIAD
jgi:hypothetical protein